jgi:ubiquinone/menaquinone biosynthesis C-methylase UbiE
VSTWGRLWAAGYDRFSAQEDRKGAAYLRALLVEEAKGDVLEVGTGTGRSLPYYRSATQVVALEPDPDMRARAQRRARQATVPVEVVDGDGMRLPFGDESFDTVVAGWVLCTIPDPGQALREARRVLGAGGTLRYCEHVRADDPSLARWQDRLARPWRWFARGCRANQDTVALMRNAGFDVSEVAGFHFDPAPAFTRPHAIGVAR